MDPSTAVPDERIFDVALLCLELFRSYPLKAQPVALKIEAEQQRFWAWSNTLKVFSKEHFSLDAQLRDPRYAEVKRMVIRLLRVLHNNLKLALETCKGPDAASIPSGQPDGLGKQSDDDLLGFALFGIDGALKRLQKLSDVILEATEGSLVRRVSVHAGKYRSEDFEKHVERTIGWRFPKLHRSLHETLVKTSIHRHYRLLYERDRRYKAAPRLPSLRRPVPPQASPTAPGVKDEKEAKKGDTTDPQPPPGTNPSISELHSGPLTIDNELANQKIEERSSAPSESKNDNDAVSETGRPFYPRPPKIPDGQELGTCPLCLKEIPAGEFLSPEWEKHVDRDLLPFVCISEDCSKNFKFFHNMGSWKHHMKKTHTPLWIRYLHNRIQCPVCSSKSPVCFDLEEDFVRHMKCDHNILDEDLDVNDGIPELRPVHKCPICGDEHPRRTFQVVDDPSGPGKGECSDDRELVSVESATTRTVHFDGPDDGSEDGLEDDPQDDRPDEVKTHERIEKNVGKHLQALAFYFAQWLVEDDDEQRLSVERSARASAARFDGLAQFENGSDPPELPILQFERFMHPSEIESIKTSREQLLRWTQVASLPHLLADNVVMHAEIVRKCFSKWFVPEQEDQDTSAEQNANALPGLFFKLSPTPDEPEFLYSDYRTAEAQWRGMGPTDALTLSAVIFLSLCFCERVVSVIGDLGYLANLNPAWDSMAQIKDNFQELHEPYSLFSGTDHSRSDFVSELISSANQSREILNDIEKAIASVSAVPNHSHLLRIVHTTQARIPELRDSLHFKLALALINSYPDALPSSGQLYVKHYSDQIRSIASSINSGKATFLRIVEEQWNALYSLRSDVLVPSPPSVPERPSSTDYLEIGDPEQNLEFPLEDQIWEAVEINIDGQNFLPVDLIDEFTTRAIVETELALRDVLYDEELILFASGPGRRLFLLLVMVENLKALSTLYKGNFDDNCFPIEVDINTRSKSGALYDVSALAQGNLSRPSYSHLFPETMWTRSSILQFASRQWVFLAPVFVKDRFFYGTIHLPQPLPFFSSKGPSKSGYFSRISHVRVHNAHQQALGLHPTSMLALKSVMGEGAGFSKEIDRTAMFQRLDHAHLAKPIAAYLRDDHFYLLMVWADGGNLRDAWAQIDKGVELRVARNSELVLWSLRQMQGLAHGLSVLHESNYRHGDLKPENLLLFTTPGSLGTLCIAHSGFTKHYFQAVSSRSTRTATMSSTFRYEPPESDQDRLDQVPRSRVYDIWSLGCIFLEFLIWLLDGQEGLNEFNYGGQLRYFWEQDEGGGTYRIHRRVQRVIDAVSFRLQYNNRNFDNALRDLFHVIISGMLQVRCGRDTPSSEPIRMTSQELVVALDPLCDRASKGLPYLFDRNLWGRGQRLASSFPPAASSSTFLTVPPRDSTLLQRPGSPRPWSGSPRPWPDSKTTPGDPQSIVVTPPTTMIE